MSRPIGLDLRRDADEAAVSITGKLDLKVRDQVAAAIAVALDQARVVVVDLSGVGFIDSSGLSALVQARNAARDGGRQLFVRGASGPVAQVLTVTGLGATFTHTGTEDDAA